MRVVIIIILIFIVNYNSKCGNITTEFDSLVWRKETFNKFTKLKDFYNLQRRTVNISKWDDFKLNAKALIIPNYVLNKRLLIHRCIDSIFNNLKISNDYKTNLSFFISQGFVWEVGTDIKGVGEYQTYHTINDTTCLNKYQMFETECFFKINNLNASFIFSIKYIKGLFYIKDGKLYSLYLGQSRDAHEFIKNNYGDEQGEKYLWSIAGK